MKHYFKKLTRFLLILALFFTQIFSVMPVVHAAESTNVALGKSIVANNYIQTYVAANANDGNSSTYWEGAANAYPNTLTIDLGSAQTVNKVILKLNSSWGARTQTLSVLTSQDNTSYSTCVSSKSYTFNPSTGNTVTISFSDITARYVRLNITANSGATGGQVAEFEVYGTASASTGTPDLIVTDISTSPDTPVAGNAVTFRATITNQGTGATTAGVVNGVSFLVDGTQVSWSDNDMSSIPAGGSITVSACGGPGGTSTWTAVNGNHTITAWVDDVDRISESDESNNQYSESLNIGQTETQPDFVVTDISYTPSAPSIGDAVTFQAVIKNQGNAQGVSGVTVFQVDGTQVSSSANSTTSIAAGSSITVTATGTWNATSGNHTITAITDNNGLQAESNESNNTYSENLTIGGATGGTPDLVVSDIMSSPSAPLTNDAVTFQAVIKNQGTGSTPAGTIIGVSFFIDDVQVSWSDNVTSSLAPGASVTVTATGGPNGTASWNATTGSHVVRAFVDDVDRITETNENNNQYSESMAVTTSPMPDFVVSNLSYSPVSPVAGDTINFTATVKNQGTASGIPGTLSIMADGTNVYTSTSVTTSLPAGSTTTVTGTWSQAQVGSHTITATIDSSGITTEGNETNNSSSINVTVSPKPGIDLVITGITYSQSYITTGDLVTFQAVVKNQGTQAGAPGRITFKVDGTQVAITNNSTTNIAAGDSVTFTANGNWTATSGTHTVTANVDSNNSTVETDETNNSYSINLTVGNGDRGATMPYTRYESEDAAIGGGAVLRSALDFNYSLTASEASNQKYVALPSNGSYVEWTINQGGAGVDMRFTMPDSSNGMGLSGSLDCYVNGSKVSTIDLSSYWSWQYFIGDQPGDAPNGGQAAFRFDEVHWKLSTPLVAGDKLRIQKTNGDSIEYGVDFVEVEAIPTAISQPANSLSVTAYGATPNDSTDDLTAFNSCVNAAASAGKTVYIPAGTFNLGGMWTINANNITITGAGMWYTNLQFTSPNASSGGISLRVTGTIDFSNVYINSMLRSRYGQNAIYKCFMDNFVLRFSKST